MRVNYEPIRKMMDKHSDVDPDPVGSALILVLGSRSIKRREKQSLTNKFVFLFVRNYIFSSLNVKV